MNFESMLRSKNLKATPQRLSILRAMQRLGHITIDEIYDLIKKDQPSISLTTIYKNIASMQEADILRKVQIPGHKSRFEIACHEHLHVSCEKCGALQDVFLDTDILSKECASLTGYKLHDVSAVFSGICPKCAN